MNELALLNQTAAIFQGVEGIQTGFAPTDYPTTLNEEDLPAAVPFLGAGSRDVDAQIGGRAICLVDESQIITIRVYLCPAAQGYDIGAQVEYSVPFLTYVLAAFDARPKLVNADGKSPGDFDWRAAGLTRAFIRTHGGVTVQPYSGILYFVADFTLTVDGYRQTAKVKGN